MQSSSEKVKEILGIYKTFFVGKKVESYTGSIILVEHVALHVTLCSCCVDRPNFIIGIDLENEKDGLIASGMFDKNNTNFVNEFIDYESDMDVALDHLLARAKEVKYSSIN